MNLSLPLIRQLGRPGILTLQRGDEPPVYAVLTGLNEQTATFQVDGQARTVPLLALGTLWRGDFATFWRPPPGYTGELADRAGGPTVDQMLADAKVVGPLTLMQLSHATGGDEPRLATESR